MRKGPGEWARTRLVKKASTAAMIFMALGGVNAGMLLGKFWPDWDIAVIIVSGTIAVVLFLVVEKGRWRLKYLQKGYRSETEVGQAIEYAITAPGCAVAHNVKGRDVRNGSQAGGNDWDIDHIVATPAGIWVIETKSSRVPKGEFKKSLYKIAKNVQDVRSWAASETNVRGCLIVNADEENARRKPYEKLGEEIFKETRQSLVKKLREEIRGAKPPSRDAQALLKRIWNLGKR